MRHSLTDTLIAPTALAHTLKSRHVAMISFGGIIGAGLFVGSSSAIAEGGPAVIIVYAAVGLLIFLIMRMLGETGPGFSPGGSIGIHGSLP